MEATVRYIPDQTAVVDGRTFATGNKPALCFRGETHALGIINDSEQICTVRLRLEEYERAPLVRYGVEEYPVAKFISHIERIMREKPISPEALQLVKHWPNNPRDFGDPIVAEVESEPSPKAQRLETIKKINCIPVLAREFETTPQKIRKFLRSQGMTAPYDQETQIRELMKTYQ